jgi:hypothetical protein
MMYVSSGSAVAARRSGPEAPPSIAIARWFCGAWLRALSGPETVPDTRTNTSSMHSFQWCTFRARCYIPTESITTNRRTLHHRHILLCRHNETTDLRVPLFGAPRALPVLLCVLFRSPAGKHGSCLCPSPADIWSRRRCSLRVVFLSLLSLHCALHRDHVSAGFVAGRLLADTHGGASW